MKPLIVLVATAALLSGCAGKTLLDSVTSIVGNMAGGASALGPLLAPPPDEQLDDDLG